MGDSKLVKKKGIWYFQLVYKVPEKNHHLDANRVATFVANDETAKRPFTLYFPDGTSYDLGNGRELLAEYDRLQLRRKRLRYHYRTGIGKGHGRKKFFAKMQPYQNAHTAMTENANYCDEFGQCWRDIAGLE